jgi:hypothetical protein
VAIFGDDSRRERRVEGVMVTHYLDTIRPEYSQLYVIRDQVMANPSRLSQVLPPDVEQVRRMCSSGLEGKILRDRKRKGNMSSS